MNRRAAIKNLLLLSTGAALIPRHLRGQNGPSISLDQIAVNAFQEDLLAEIVDTLIPPTDTPGAKALNIHLFVLMMLNDCHDTTDQANFMSGLDLVDAFAIEHTTKPFTACASSERVDLLVKMKAKQTTPPKLWTFNQLMRRRAIEGYRESEYVMTHLQPHQMIPAPYDGYYPASNYQPKEAQPHG